MRRLLPCLSAVVAFGLAFGAATQAAAARDSGYHRFECSNNTVLRIIFDEEDRTATVVRFRQPTIRLQQAEAEEGFRYVRGESHELRGTLNEVRWRVGGGEWVCRRRG